MSRFVVFGSFITAKEEPNDVDVFMLMEDSFYLSEHTGEVHLLFSNHAVAQSRFGASVFWMSRLAALYGEEKRLKIGRPNVTVDKEALLRLLRSKYDKK